MLTTKDIIKILPFKPEFKDDLLEKFDSLSEDQRFGIQGIVWDLYDALYEARLDANMQIAMERAKKHEEKLDHEFYERVRQQTDREFEKESSETAASVDLSSARDELAKILGHTTQNDHNKQDN